MKVLLLILGFPLLELFLMIQVGTEIGALATVLWVVVSAVLGFFIIQSQGIDTVARVRDGLMEGESPAVGVLEGMLLAVAGILLVIPGLLTDALAVLFIFPLTRGYFVKKMMQKGSMTFRFRAKANGRVYEGHAESKPDETRVLEGEIVEREEKK